MEIGLFTDNHESGFEKTIANALANLNVDLIVNMGDLIERPERDILVSTMEEFCKTQIPFISIPGNYETVDSWKDACEYLSRRYPNFVNGAQNPLYSFQDFGLVLIPGSERFNRGFEISDKCATNPTNHSSNPQKIGERIRKDKLDISRTLLFCHEPPKQEHETGTDVAVQGVNVLNGSVVFGRSTREAIESGYYKKRFSNQGSELTRQLVNQLGINFVFSGHIHEGLGAFTKDGEPVKEKEYSSSLYFNPGPAKNGIYSTISLDTIVGELQASYQRFALLGHTGYESL
ncbi:MAG: metallophosphoesterase [archaeon]